MNLHKDINSKLRIFFVLVVLSVLIASCKKSELDVIPYVYVEFSIPVNDPSFINFFEVPTSHVLVDATTNNEGSKAGGYDGNGIILYCAQPGEYYAFDRTCPHDLSINGTSVAVEVEAGSIYAICPECSSHFALPSFGSPSDGPSKYPLKMYHTSYNGSYLRVYN